MGGSYLANQQVGVSDDGLGVSGSTGAFAKDGLALNNSDLILGGVSLGGANTGTITVNSGAGVADLAEKFTDTLNGLATSQTQTTKQAADSATQQTESLRSLLLYAAAGVGLLLLATIFLRK